MTQRAQHDAVVPQGLRKKFSPRDWERHVKDYEFKCYYCNVPLMVESAVKEHLVPICRGGVDSLENIVPACVTCNLMKAWRTAEEFIRDRPALIAKRTASRAKDKPNPYRLSLEETNEPGLLKKLIDERERRSPWWRHPA